LRRIDYYCPQQRCIAGITGQVTLHPVDVIRPGTDDATESSLADGQVCEILQQDIGVLRNPVVREKA
jgi:2-keto-4-pentenoate hydratase/2-oxohepta-3-ene-1,7-dioic acid hydratase in catechol pathway